MPVTAKSVPLENGQVPDLRVAGIDEAHLAQVGELAMHRTIDGLAMRADAISIGLAVSLVGNEPDAPR